MTGPKEKDALSYNNSRKFQYPLSSVYWFLGQKKTVLSELTYTIGLKDLIDIYKIFNPINAEYTFFLEVHGNSTT